MNAQAGQFALSLSSVKLAQKPGKGFDWAAYNATFAPTFVTPTDLLLAVAQGQSFTPLFTGTRSKETWAEAQHIGLDFDGGDMGLGKLLSHPFLRSYACLFYPTTSSTEAAPRYRVVIALSEPIRTAEGYLLALQTVHSLFPAADPACVDISRLFYGNARIQGEGLWEQCYVADILMPLSDLRMYAKRLLKQRQPVLHRQPAQTVQQRRERGVEGLSIDEAFERLSTIHPYAMPYQEWVRLGAAFAHCYGELAFGRFKAWSDVPGKPGLSLATWKSMSRPHGNPVGMGTLIATLHQYERRAA